MGIKEKICPICGRSDKEVTFHGFICSEDFLATKKIKVPSSIMVQICKYGDKMQINAWTNNPDDLLPQVKRLIKAKGIEITHIDIDLEKAVAEVELSVDDEKIRKFIPLDVRRTLCDLHARATRGYYESIIQVRMSEDLERTEDKELIASKIQRTADRITVMLQQEERGEIYIRQDRVRGGIDVYTSSTAATFRVLSALGIRNNISRKLWTQKKGKQLFRTTFLVRVPYKAPKKPGQEEPENESAEEEQ
ncbi:NMD3 family protein [uncultured archaeon]|nr:NMD3 family protein [uncultured archaeon]